VKRTFWEVTSLGKMISAENINKKHPVTLIKLNASGL